MARACLCVLPTGVCDHHGFSKRILPIICDAFTHKGVPVDEHPRAAARWIPRVLPPISPLSLEITLHSIMLLYEDRYRARTLPPSKCVPEPTRRFGLCALLSFQSRAAVDDVPGIG